METDINDRWEHAAYDRNKIIKMVSYPGNVQVLCATRIKSVKGCAREMDE